MVTAEVEFVVPSASVVASEVPQGVNNESCKQEGNSCKQEGNSGAAEDSQQRTLTGCSTPGTGPAALTSVLSLEPTSLETTCTRPRRTNAGYKLQAILEEEKLGGEDGVVMDEEEEHSASLGTLEDGGEGSCAGTNCCICAKFVARGDISVTCRGSHCSATAHYFCAGYTSKGAKRAKFYCGSCRVKYPPSKSKKSPVANTGSSAGMILPPLTHKPPKIL